MESGEFEADALTEYNDALLMTYLSSITKGSNLATEVLLFFWVVESLTSCICVLEIS